MMGLEQAKATLGDEFRFFCDFISSQLERFQLPKDVRILDVGTGKGRVAVTLALKGYRVVTGEPVDDHSEYAKQNWRDEAEKVGATDAITYKPFNAEAMPFADGDFDVIFVMGAMHHMETPHKAVAELRRVLAPEGVVVVLEPTAELIEKVRARFPDHPDPVDPRLFAEGMTLAKRHTEMFDVYELRHATGGAHPE